MIRKNSNKSKKINWSKLALPLIIALLFIGSSIAYFMFIGFSIGSSSDPLAKDLEKLLSKEGLNVLMIKKYGENDFYYIYYIVLSDKSYIPIYITKDNRFYGKFEFQKLEENDIDSIKLALSQISPIIPNNFTKISDNKDYKIYKVNNKSVYFNDFENIYFLIGNSSILIALKNPKYN